MKLEQQVCSLELAKQLKELGVYQYSEFYWIERKGVWIVEYRGLCIHERKDGYSAFTASELGEMLPATITRRGKVYLLKISKSLKDIQFVSDDAWEVRYMDIESIYAEEYSNSLANAMAKMLIYLITNKLIVL